VNKYKYKFKNIYNPFYTIYSSIVYTPIYKEVPYIIEMSWDFELCGKIAEYSDQVNFE